MADISVGMKVRYVETQDFGPNKGECGVVERVSAHHFHVRVGESIYWTTRQEVEIIQEGNDG